MYCNTIIQVFPFLSAEPSNPYKCLLCLSATTQKISVPSPTLPARYDPHSSTCGLLLRLPSNSQCSYLSPTLSPPCTSRLPCAFLIFAQALHPSSGDCSPPSLYCQARGLCSPTFTKKPLSVIPVQSRGDLLSILLLVT